MLPESIRWRTLRPDIFGPVEAFVTQRYPDGLSGIAELPNLAEPALRARLRRGRDKPESSARTGCARSPASSG